MDPRDTIPQKNHRQGHDPKEKIQLHQTSQGSRTVREKSKEPTVRTFGNSGPCSLVTLFNPGDTEMTVTGSYNCKEVDAVAATSH